MEFTTTRRVFGKIVVGGSVLLGLRHLFAPRRGVAQTFGHTGSTSPPDRSPAPHHALVVIGSGFGGTMTALSVAREFDRRGKGESVLILERGTWWTTPVETVQDREVKTYDFLQKRDQPVQFWSSADDGKGLRDLVLRCIRSPLNRGGFLGTILGWFGLRPPNQVGLYDLTVFRKPDGTKAGVTVARAAGVGGGSLVYLNVTIRPPRAVFDDDRWPLSWSYAHTPSPAVDSADAYYDLARDAIGKGVLSALDNRDRVQENRRAKPVNTGLSNVATRSPLLDPHWQILPDPDNARRGLKRLHPRPSSHQPPPTDPHSDSNDPRNDLWITRARVFQTAASAVTEEYGTVDSSINDIDVSVAYNPGDFPKNYCERQGRCMLGCLPGARQTLNKQLMRAIFGAPPPGELTTDTPADFPAGRITLEALAEVDVIRARPEGGYEITYRNPTKPFDGLRRVSADRIIVAAGTIGTNEIMLRSKERGTLPNLSDKVGWGFSTNGDYIAFLEKTTRYVNLTRGPMTTSFAHFAKGDRRAFHTVEDNGIPRVLTTLVGRGVEALQALGSGDLEKIAGLVAAKLKEEPAEALSHVPSGEDLTARMICVNAMGCEQAVGRFTRERDILGGTDLRLERTDGEFHEDPIYREIKATLARLARMLTDDPSGKFVNPFEEIDMVGCSHPLGGCRMATSSEGGVVDEWGRVFSTDVHGHDRAFHKGLYIADGSIMPTALGVNPSLTIAALALRIADHIVSELRAET